MLNYLNAEVFKILRQRSFCASLSLLLFCEGLLLLAQRLAGTAWSFNQSVAFLLGILPIGFFLIVPLGNVVFSEQYKSQALKNEVSFGLPRPRIYLGKLFAAAIVCGATCILAIGFFLGFSWIFCPLELGGELLADLPGLGYCLLTALPLWLGALGLLYALQFTVKNTVWVVVLYLSLFLVMSPTLMVLQEVDELIQGQNIVLATLRQGLLPTPLAGLSNYLFSPERMCWAWLVGMGWLAGTTMIGLAVFRRRELK